MLVLCLGRTTPVGIAGSSKYGGQGHSDGSMFAAGKLTDKMKDTLATWVNNSKANSTWSTYRTAERLILTCQKQEGKKFDWPMTNEDTLIFIYWLIEKRGVKVTSVNSYLAGARQLHISKGLEPPVLRTEIVKQALKGRAHMERQLHRTTKQRLPMTMALMQLLKERTRLASMTTETKRMFWSMSTLMFFGAFRVSEVASQQESTFDPDHTLLTEDVKLRTTRQGATLEITLKCPKENKDGKPTVVDVFESGGALCPVTAFKKWIEQRTPEQGLPLFRDETGTPVTARRFNTYLHTMLGDQAEKRGGTLTSHSFRAGITTIMGTMGYDDEDIKLVGRWSSRAFAIYMKGPRTQRASIAKKMKEWTDKA